MTERRPFLRVASVVALLGVAYALRLTELDGQSLWWDEGISLHLATSSLAEIVADRASNIHPPLYFILLKGWVSLAGISVFSGRYLSVLASATQVAAVLALTRRWLGTAPAWLAACLVAISPLSIIYGQEIRVYAMLPLVYLAMLALAREIGRGTPTGPLLGLLALLEWTGIHLHYTAFFVCALVIGWSLVMILVRRRSLWRPWIRVHLLVGVASMPWLIAVLRRWPDVQTRIEIGRYLTEPVPWPFLIAQVWSFQFSGLAGALGRPQIRWPVLVVAIAAACLILIRLLAARRNAVVVSLLGQWLIPLGLAFAVWSLRSFAHPRYTIMFSIGLYPLLGYLVIPGASWRFADARAHGPSALATLFLSAVLLAALVVTSISSLQLYLFDPSVAKDDMRGVARFLEREAGPSDLIVVPDEGGWAFQFEYEGSAVVMMPGLKDVARRWTRWQSQTRSSPSVYLVQQAPSSRDWQGVIPFALEKSGTLTGVTKFDGVHVHAYELNEAVMQPALMDRTAIFEWLRLTGVWLESPVAAGEAITLALRWEIIQETDKQAMVAVRLLDIDGWQLASRDELLLNVIGQPTEAWQVGETVTTYHLLPVSPSTPPLRFDLMIQPYIREGQRIHVLEGLEDGTLLKEQQLFLGPVEIGRSEAAGTDPYGAGSEAGNQPEVAELADGLSLIATDLDREEVAPGQVLFVQLLWQANSGELADWRPILSLEHGGTRWILAEDAPVQGRYPTSRWRAGEQVQDHYRLVVPADVEPGPAEVVISIGGNRALVGRLEILAESRLYEDPEPALRLDRQFGTVVRLVGADIPPSTVASTDRLPVTLYWQALETGNPIEYKVFTHVIDQSGRLIGQHDAPPANGRRPIPGWVAGEYVVDRHQIEFRETSYDGTAQIVVGLYDPATGERLPTASGADLVLLPVDLTVKPAADVQP